MGVGSAGQGSAKALVHVWACAAPIIADMPELPEVEVTRQTLAPALEGARIQHVEVGKPLRWPLGVEPQQLRGCSFGALSRRGKYLWMPLVHPSSTPNAVAGSAGGLLVHLGMSGSLGFTPASSAVAPRGVHEHVRIVTDRGVLGSVRCV